MKLNKHQKKQLEDFMLKQEGGLWGLKDWEEFIAQLEADAVDEKIDEWKIEKHFRK